jgi:hypothetical protein
MHRGRIGGGRKGVGRTLFFNHYLGGEFVDVKDGESVSTLALIGDLDSPRLAYQIANFVHEVQRVKSLAGKPAPPRRRQPTFSGEPGSRKGYRLSGRMIQPSADHALIVAALAKFLTARKQAVYNDRNRDLFTSRTGILKCLFEVKTSSSLGDVYQAIGQLLFNSANTRRTPDLVLVCPRLPNPISRVLAQLGIRHTVRFDRTLFRPLRLARGEGGATALLLEGPSHSTARPRSARCGSGSCQLRQG